MCLIVVFNYGLRVDQWYRAHLMCAQYEINPRQYVSVVAVLVLTPMLIYLQENVLSISLNT